MALWPLCSELVLTPSKPAAWILAIPASRAVRATADATRATTTHERTASPSHGRVSTNAVTRSHHPSMTVTGPRNVLLVMATARLESVHPTGTVLNGPIRG